MNKYLYFILLSVLILSALACSGGGSNVENTRSIAGSIDATLVGSSLTDIEVWAVENDEAFRKGSITLGVNGEDHTYLVKGLKDNVEYRVVIYRAYGYEKLELLSTLVTTNSTTGSLSKPLRSKTKTKRQINVLTTFITNKLLNARSTGGTDTMSSILTTIFDGDINNIDLINIEGGEISVTGSNQKTLIKDSYFQMAVTQMTMATVAGISVDSSQIRAQAANFDFFSKKMTEANNSTIMTSISDSGAYLSSMIANAGGAFATRYETADKVVANALKQSASGDLQSFLQIAPVTTHIIASYTAVSVRSVTSGADLPGTFINGLVASASSLNGVTEATIKSDSVTLISKLDSGIISDTQKITAQNVVNIGGTSEKNDIAVLKVSSFSLANESYGTQNGNDFVLHSLAPVFKIVLSEPMTKNLAKAVTVVLTHGSTSQILNSGNVTVSDDDDLTFYILAHNSGATKVDSKSELAPGEVYSYSISASDNTFALQLASGVSSTGNVKVADITYTLPFDNFDFTQSQISLNSVYKGLKNQNTLFNVNTTHAIQYTSSTSSTTDFGLLNYFPIDLSAVASRTGNISNVNFFDIYTTTETGSASWLKGYDLIFSGNQIESGRINLSSNPSLINFDSDDDGIADGNVSDLNWTIPDHIYIDKQ